MRIFAWMKATVDLPDDLMDAVKLRAEREGRSIKEVLVELLSTALGGVRKKHGAGKLKYSELPVLKGGTKAKPDQEITPDKVADILWGAGA